MVCIYYINSDRNARRFYTLNIVTDLFANNVLVRTWGRIGRHGVLKCEAFPSFEAAMLALEKIHRDKIRKGYRADPCWDDARKTTAAG